MIIEIVQQSFQTELASKQLLSEYDFAGTLKPSVFIDAPAPTDAISPVMVLTLEGGDEEESTQENRLFDFGIQVRLWGDKGKKIGSLSALSKAVWKSFHRTTGNLRRLTFPGIGVGFCRCGIPRSIVDPEGYPGYIIDIDVNMVEE